MHEVLNVLSVVIAGDPNATNRLMTAEAVYGAYRELDAVLAGDATAEEIEEAGYSAHAAVPQWTQQHQDGVEAITHQVDDTVGGDAAIIQPYIGTGLELLFGQSFTEDGPPAGGYSPPRKY